jgi:hypothetical protein
MSHSPLLKGRSIIPHIYILNILALLKKEYVSTGTTNVSMLHFDCKRIPLFSYQRMFSPKNSQVISFQ